MEHGGQDGHDDDGATRVARLGPTVIGLDAARAGEHAAALGLQVRVLRPGAVHTMEYVEGRANLVLGDDDVVERVFHG